MTTDALVINNLSKSYGHLSALDDISLSIPPGEIFGLLGPNGAGKSTAINLISGVARMERGTIAVFGYDNIRDYRISRRLTGVVHQEFVVEQFFEIGRALELHSGLYGVRDDAAWRKLLVERLELGAHLHKRFIKLSGGLKRRFMIAKALVHKPHLLILDEPSAGVDVELRHTLWEFVREINSKGATVLLTTHYLEEAERLCGRIGILNHGRLIALERTGDLLKKVGERTVCITFQEPILGEPPELAHLNLNITPDRKHASLHLYGDTPIGEALDSFTRAGIHIHDLATGRATLEEVFLQLTGRDNKIADSREKQNGL